MICSTIYYLRMLDVSVYLHPQLEPGWFKLVQVTKAIRALPGIQKYLCCHLAVYCLVLSGKQSQYTRRLSTVVKVSCRGGSTRGAHCPAHHQRTTSTLHWFRLVGGMDTTKLALFQSRVSRRMEGCHLL